MISFSFGSHALAVSSSGKHFSSTLIAMKAAVEAPGEAPSSATSERSAAPTSSVPNSSSAAAFCVRLDDLNALPRDLQPPVFGLGIGEIFVERG